MPSLRTVTLCVALAACTAPDDDTPHTGCDTGCAEVGVLEVGTGATSFEPLSDGDPLDLVPGFQGLQHVHVSLRAPVDPTTLLVPRANVVLTLTRLRDEVVVISGQSAGYALEAVDGQAVVAGIQLVIDEPADVLGLDVRVDASLQPVGGERYVGEMAGEVRWAASE